MTLLITGGEALRLGGDKDIAKQAIKKTEDQRTNFSVTQD